MFYSSRLCQWRPWRLAALAASVVLVVGVSIRLMQDYGYLSTGDLARDVVAHIHHEPGAVRVAVVPAGSAVAKADVDSVLERAGAEMDRIRPMVRYARLCPFRGEMVASAISDHIRRNWRRCIRRMTMTMPTC